MPFQEHRLFCVPTEIEVSIDLGFGTFAVKTFVRKISLTNGKIVSSGRGCGCFFGDGLELEKVGAGACQSAKFRQGTGTFLDRLVAQEYGGTEQDEPFAVHPSLCNKDGAESEDEHHGQNRDGFHYQGKAVLAYRKAPCMFAEVSGVALECSRKSSPFLRGAPGAEQSPGHVEVVPEFRLFKQQGFFFGTHAVDFALEESYQGHDNQEKE